MAPQKQQNGMSMMNVLMLLVVVAFLASAAFKIIPHYFDFMAVEKMIMAIEGPAGESITSPADVYGHLSRGMEVNGIRDLNLQESFNIRQEGNDFFIKADYERRENLIKNIDLVVKFEKEFRVRAPQ